MTENESTRTSILETPGTDDHAVSPAETPLAASIETSRALDSEEMVVDLESIVELGPQAKIPVVATEPVDMPSAEASPWPRQNEENAPSVETERPVSEAVLVAEEPVAVPQSQSESDEPPAPPVAQAAGGGNDGKDGGNLPTMPNSEVPSVPESPAAPEKSDEESDEKPMSLLDHLGELRRRLMWSFIAVFVCFLGCYHFAQTLFHYLTLPLLQVMPADSKFMFTGVAEGFFVELKVAFVAGIFVASPYLFYQIWAFVSPGLYDQEKRYIIPISLASAIFFIGGAAFCYFGVFPFAFIFFLSYANDTIVAMLSISEYLSFTLKMLLAFGLVFEMPLFAFFLARMGLLTAKKMRAWRRYAVLTIFIVAAVLTPPDVFSQLMMAGPMLLLYELSIFVAVLAQQKTTPQKDDDKTQPSETAGDNT